NNEIRESQEDLIKLYIELEEVDVNLAEKSPLLSTSELEKIGQFIWSYLVVGKDDIRVRLAKKKV
ncbi:hypothetical protein ACLOJK_003679, partial [Asimina triloba]